MDPNLEKIKEANMYAITHGTVQQAIIQAEDYLTYVVGFDREKIELELETFINNIKAVRRESRGQRRREEA